MPPKMTAQEIQESLNQFYGTTEWHRWSILYRQFLLTDGAKFVAESCGAYWLMDLIASYQKRLLRAGQFFQVWKLGTTGSKGVVTCEDGNGKRLVRQALAFTDFPLDEITLWAEWDGQNLVILLPSEH
jgi:hypothetical protein